MLPSKHYNLTSEVEAGVKEVDTCLGISDLWGMSYQFYNWLHLAGVFMVIMSLGALAFSSVVGDPKTHPLRLKATLFHGIGLLVVFVAGFGLLAKVGAMSGGLPGWAIAKIAIWLCLGGTLVLAKRNRNLAIPVWWGVFILACLAGWLAIFKPF